jgi:hypothetical protein
MNSIHTLTKTEILKRAEEHFFSLGVGDGASSLCQANFKYGLAKLHYAQESLGLDPNATFISTPDETISRNKRRWKNGYGYGGKLCTGDPNDPLIFVDVKPNACGMLVGGLDTLPKPDEIIKKIYSIIEREYYIDDVKIQWDYERGNHFIDVFKRETNPEPQIKLPKYMFIIHGSIPELRGDDNKKGFGLYYDKSHNLFEMCKNIDTPFGKVYYIDGNNAKEYLKLYQMAKEMAAKKRVHAAKLMFGEFEIISNPVHQGLLSYGEFLLGAQHITEEPNKIFPLALRSDMAAYLISTNPNLEEEEIQKLGFEKRAKKHQVYDRLRNFNCIPHGGGYLIPHISYVKNVLEINSNRYFICEQEHEEGIMVLTDVGSTQFTYRGKQIIKKIQEMNLGQIEAKLFPRFVLKI